MDMSGMSSSVTMDMATMTSSGHEAMSTAADHDMEGMDMMGGCKISMLWNWNTIDACFISESWHITSKGMFAGSCIGVLLLVMTLEALRRASREYDIYIMRAYQRSLSTSQSSNGGPLEAGSSSPNKSSAAQATTPLLPTQQTFTPSLFQQIVRAFLHMAQFAVAYFVMLLAMYYNGYFIICIFIGAFLGAFAFNWHSMALPGEQRSVTYCCG
ncbi:hypothetical protein Q7P37_010809 [Cladosporium fusiforme]